MAPHSQSKTLTIGILAHVDAGKTSLTERILFETGVIRALGRVDTGTTQTDTMELERARGITIQAAVVAFRLRELNVNLIDTPGHGDFIAEVQRALEVLDAVVLVVSAVEGVQSQTRRLARAIRAAGVPLAIFVNKIDRAGARSDALLDDIRTKLQLRVVPLNHPGNLGSREACVTPQAWGDAAWRAATIDLLAESDEGSERVIAEFERTDGEIGDDFLQEELRRQVATADVVPAFFGSAMTGEGVSALLDGIECWFPRAGGDPEAPTSGTVFTIRRTSTGNGNGNGSGGSAGGHGEKLVYVRLFDGSLNVRQWVPLRARGERHDAEMHADEDTDIDVADDAPPTREERITALEHFSGNIPVRGDVATAGDIVVLHGLRSARIGDRVGPADPQDRQLAAAFPPPALESIVRPVNAAQMTGLRTALEQIAEQDPLISLRQRNAQGEISVRLYGEVQKEVLSDTLLREHGIPIEFGETRVVCIERPVGTGSYVEFMMEGENPWWATVGLRVEPGPIGSGIRYVQSLGMMPNAYYAVVKDMVYRTLTQGLYGWEVTDAVVTVTHAHYKVPVSNGTHYRRLTPIILMRALDEAGTVVCEPIETLTLEIPEDTFGTVCGALIAARATIDHSEPHGAGATYHLTCTIPTAEVRGVEQQLPGLTRGEAGWETQPAGYVPVTGEPPVQERIGANPLNREHYLQEVGRAT